MVCRGTSASWSMVWVLGQPTATGEPASVKSTCGTGIGMQSPQNYINHDTLPETTVF